MRPQVRSIFPSPSPLISRADRAEALEELSPTPFVPTEDYDCAPVHEDAHAYEADRRALDVAPYIELGKNNVFDWDDSDNDKAPLKVLGG